MLLIEACFTVAPYGLTLECQYIIRHLVIISDPLIIGGTALRRTNVRPDAAITRRRPYSVHDGDSTTLLTAPDPSLDFEGNLCSPPSATAPRSPLSAAGVSIDVDRNHARSLLPSQAA